MSSPVRTTTPNSNALAIKYKGVRLRKWGKYVSEIRLPNSRQRIWLGSYPTAHQAARAFDAALFCLRGPAATFNFPDQPPTAINVPAHHRRDLKPDDIRVIARNYAFSFGGTADVPPAAAAAAVAEVEQQEDEEVIEKESPTSSNLESVAAAMESMDWHFLEELEWRVNSSGGISVSDGFNLPPLLSQDDNDDDADGYIRLWDFSEHPKSK